MNPSRWTTWSLLFATSAPCLVADSPTHNAPPSSTPIPSARHNRGPVIVGAVKIVGGMPIQEVTFTPTIPLESPDSEPTESPAKESSGGIRMSLTDWPVEDGVLEDAIFEDAPDHDAKLSEPSSVATRERALRSGPSRRVPVAATVTHVDVKTGRVQLRSTQAAIPSKSSVKVYHKYLTGEELIGHMVVIKNNGSGTAVAQVSDREMLNRIQTGDRAVCH